VVNALRAAFYYSGRLKFWQAFQPQAGCLCFAMPELPRLNDLVGLADVCADYADRVFQGDERDRRVEQGANKLKCGCLLVALGGEPARATDGQMCTRRKSNEHVPTISYD